MDTSRKGLRLEYMDQSHDPKENFYGFANGKWAENNPIPDEYARWGTFMILRDQVLETLKEICEANSHTNISKEELNAAKIGQFWRTAMDEDAIETAGLSSIHNLFDQVDAVSSVKDFASLAGHLHSVGISTLYSVSLVPDFKDSTTERLFVAQGGLGLPNRDYYFDESKQEIREKYITHVSSMFQLTGMNVEESKSASQIIFELETALAKISRTPTAMRDMPSLYNTRTISQLQEQKWPWLCYFESAGYNTEAAPFIIKATPEFFEHLSEAISESTLARWKIYTKWHIIHSLAGYLPKRFVDENFEFEKVVTGVKELQPRWKRVVSTLNNVAGELLGQVYCDQHFSSKSKEKCIEMVERLREALAQTVKNLEWMSDETKAKALRKLKAFGVKIGFPDKWTDYSDLVFPGDSYVANVLAANKFNHSIDMNRVDKPVEPHRWEMPPQTVNAYYHPMKNEIVFPAAILQAPAFDADRDDAMNFGAIGAVIGHEMTHGFDDQGRLFDHEGNMVDWWAPSDADNFKSRASKAVDQYGKLEVFGQKVNGALTQGENIADIGGVKIAFNALQNLYKEKGRPQDIDGFTGEQRFFLSWTQFWAGSVREAEALRLLSIDPHSPSDVRATQPLRNVQDFFNTFDITEGNAMYLAPDERIIIWG